MRNAVGILLFGWGAGFLALGAWIMCEPGENLPDNEVIGGVLVIVGFWSCWFWLFSYVDLASISR